MLLADLVAVADRVAAVSGRRAKVAALAEALARMTPEEAPIGASLLAGAARQGRLGIGPALLASVAPPAAERPSLSLLALDAMLSRLGELSGPGSAAARAEMLGSLLAAATAAEQSFLRRLLHGELRQGALAGVMVEAIARAATVPPAAVRRALMVSASLGAVAAAALAGGADALGAQEVELFRPLQPMLAQGAEDVGEALSRLGEASLEAKLDGARVQVHKGGSEVRVFSRRLHDVTAAVPEVAEAVRALPARELILDGEVVALRRDGRPHPFQVTMRRFGRKLDVAAMREDLPLAPSFFDCLWVDGEGLLAAPQRRRLQALEGIAPAGLRVERLVTADAATGEAFRRRVLAQGHEGIMAKALDAPYEAGSRGATWLKIKRAKTLDLVVLAAEWGHGRRQGWLSNLHLGARHPGGGFAMLGKTFKGLTDELLAWQTERLLELAVARERHVVRVRPELVVEVAYNDLQESPRYPARLALRFARVKGYRPDKRPEDADTLDTVRAAYRRDTGLEPP